jgi:hypothetical protein
MTRYLPFAPVRKANLEEQQRVDCPFGPPSGTGRYLRIPAIAAPSSDNKIHFHDSS